MMQELLKQKLPLYLLTRVWFLANCSVAVLFGLFLIVSVVIHYDAGLTMPLFLAVIFIGFLLSLPFLIILIILNDIYKAKKVEAMTIKEYIIASIICINLVYLILTLIYFDRNFSVIIFYTVTTFAGIFSLRFLTKKYFRDGPNSE